MGAARWIAQVGARGMVAALIREHALEHQDFLTPAVNVPIEVLIGSGKPSAWPRPAEMGLTVPVLDQ